MSILEQWTSELAGSIEGAFGLEFGSYFTDVYGLRVEAERDKAPRWICRVQPDNQRDLRCSFETKGVLEFEPSFKLSGGRNGGRQVPNAR